VGQLAVTVFVNQKKILQTVVLIAMKDITRRDATITMFIGTIATVKGMIRHKNVEIRDGQMNTDAQGIGFRESG
jgi:hypothetical protein